MGANLQEISRGARIMVRKGSREGWSCEDGGRVIGVNPKRFPAATEPAFEKVAALWEEDPMRTLTEMALALERVRRKRSQT